MFQLSGFYRRPSPSAYRLLRAGSRSQGPLQDYTILYMGSYQNDGPLLGPLNTRCRRILGPKKGP